MAYDIKIAGSQKEKDAVFSFRYEVYVEELQKNHIQADHQQRMIYDQADSFSLLYYCMKESALISRVRSQRGAEGSFRNEDATYFQIDDFEQVCHYHEMAIVDRLMVAKSHRHGPLGHEMMLATYLDGLRLGTKVCFITCEEKLLNMYFRYGFRRYGQPAALSNGEGRFKLVLYLCDRAYLQQAGSPFLPYLDKNWDDRGLYAARTEEALHLKLAGDARAFRMG